MRSVKEKSQWKKEKQIAAKEHKEGKWELISPRSLRSFEAILPKPL
jgi:hypothetical protein